MSPAPAAAMPALSARSASPSVTSRADIVRLAQASGPWAFLPVGLVAMRNHPDDHEMRFLVAAAFARLALVTAARDHLALLPGELRADAGVAALAAAMDRLPDDRVSPAALAATCRGNLAALAKRQAEPIDLTVHLPAWEQRAAGWDWFRAHDGHIVRRARATLPGMGDRWLHLADIRGQVAGVMLPHAAPGVTGPIKPYVLEGMDPPWLVERVLRETPAAADGYDARVTIVHEDPLELLDGLAQADLREWLARPRVRVIVGPGAGEALLRSLLGAMDAQIVGHGLSMSTVRTPVSPTVEGALQLAGRAQWAEQQRLIERVRARYAGRDRAWWAGRYAQGASIAKAGAAARGSDGNPPPGPLPLGGGVGPLRVLIPTCRFSTYIKHASADLAAALRGLGFEARVVMEPDDHSQLSGVAYLRAIDEFDPDLVVLINYARANINGAAGAAGEGGGSGAAGGVIPLEVPYVMWIQDAMPQQLDERVGRGMGELDFVAGNLRNELFWRFGYPRGRALDAPIVASRAKFHAGEVARELRERHACEVAYVSHHSETPEAMHERKSREARASAGLGAVLERLRPLVERETGAASPDPLSLRLRSVTARAVRDNGGNGDDPRLVEQLMQMYALPMADRLLRHQTLAWAAEIAERRGWRLHLYGRGWEQHPTLGQHARGELAHGEELRACYQAAAVHLQVSAHSIIHQRMIECVLSGGLPLSRLTEEDLSSLSYLAAVGAAGRREPGSREYDVALRSTIGGTRHRYVGLAIADGPEAMQLTALRQRLGLGERTPSDASAFAWINSVHLDRLHGRDPEGVPLGEVPRERSLFWLLGDPAECVFTGREGFEALLTRAVESPEWRTRTAAALRARFEQHLTHEAFAAGLVDFVAERLRAGAAVEGSRS